MKISKWLLVLAMVFVALPAAAVSVDVDYDKSADFSKFNPRSR